MGAPLIWIWLCMKQLRQDKVCPASTASAEDAVTRNQKKTLVSRTGDKTTICHQQFCVNPYCDYRSWLRLFASSPAASRTTSSNTVEFTWTFGQLIRIWTRMRYSRRGEIFLFSTKSVIFHEFSVTPNTRWFQALWICSRCKSTPTHIFGHGTCNFFVSCQEHDRETVL